MPAAKYSEDQINTALEMRERGLSTGQIEMKTNVPQSSIVYHCMMKGIDRGNLDEKPYMHRTPITYMRNGVEVRQFLLEEDAEILRMALLNKSHNHIAIKMGRKRHTITQRLATLARKQAREENNQTKPKRTTK